MTDEAIRGVVRGGMVLFLETDARLPEGTEVLVTPVAHQSGSAAAVLAALATSPEVPAEWVDELERVIANGRRPPWRQDLFADELGSQECP